MAPGSRADRTSPAVRLTTSGPPRAPLTGYPNKWQRQDLGTDLVFMDNEGLIWAVRGAVCISAPIVNLSDVLTDTLYSAF